ncbi:restriction endonuclease subunit S [Acetivibrio mesophilus]|uniref:Restriction endonuclease subunit S n=1 Tax=Acetivibrio mesophilus TaxID=2487273 RepID=A0A4Q0I0H5_9FIRM|nr:restriction endonuclease subunit S [Acetivibrio mesophilus]RXE57706.1 restriction endonuclease subunit S [Acetivibrio mesophilus]
MKWTNYRLGDLIEIKHGYAFSGTYITQEDNGIVLVTPGNFRIGGGFQEEKCKFFNGDVPEEYILRPGDLIVTMTDLSKNTDTLGYSALVPKSSRTYLHNQRIGLVKMKTDCVDYKFLYWLMRTHTYQRTIANSATGATVKHTSPTKIYEYQFNAPEKNVQKKIAGILSAYDDLIENNQKQIKLLEEAAMRLYEEWFVNLRFPGHENTKIVDGLPEGWSRKKLIDIAEITMGQSPKSEYYNDRQQGLPFHQGVTNYGYRFVIDETYSTSYTRIAEAGSILFSVRAPVGRMNITKNKIVIGRGLAAINHREGLQSFLFYMLKNRFYKDDLIGNGAIYASITKAALHSQEFLIPCDNLANEFNNVAKSIDQQITNADRQIILLQQARDKLLSKLMNGDIEV